MAHQLDRFVPPELMRQLGRLAFHFQLLESAVRFRIGQCFEEEAAPLVALLIAGVPFSQLPEKLLALYRHRLGPHPAVDTLSALVDRMGKANEKRNGFMHSAWMDVDQEDGQAVRITRPRRKVLPGEPVDEIPIREVEEAADECAQLTRELGLLAPQLAAALPRRAD